MHLTLSVRLPDSVLSIRARRCWRLTAGAGGDACKRSDGGVDLVVVQRPGCGPAPLRVRELAAREAPKQT